MLTQQEIESMTETDPCMRKSALDDDVVQLREWGSHRIHRLPPRPETSRQVDWMIGSGADCATRLTDITRRVSTHHARLLWNRSHWGLLDLGSKNGLRVDGWLQASALLTPGTEIAIGGLTLIAESERVIGLRSFLCRLLGWGPERLAVVDEALRAIRSARVQRAPLVLRGEGDWVTVARDLHHRIVGASQPFVLCAPRGPSMDANLRGIATIEKGLAAIAAARGGSLCVRSRRPPVELVRLASMLRSPNASGQLMICDDSRTDAPSALALPITIPSLLSRYAELPRIVEEYCRDAAAAFGARMDSGEIRAWIFHHTSTSIPDIERAAYRLFAIRASKTLDSAAELLGIDVQALRAWLQRHKLGGGTLPPLGEPSDA
jgi:Inner membrane component of T3SS, cytoplasmic domain